MNQVLDLVDNSLVLLSLLFAAVGILFAFLYLEHVQSFLSQNVVSSASFVPMIFATRRTHDYAN